MTAIIRHVPNNVVGLSLLNIFLFPTIPAIKQILAYQGDRIWEIMKARAKHKVAIVYDRVNKWGGAERVLLALHEIFPDAPLYTSVYDKKNAKWAKVFLKVVTSFLQKFPFAKSNHEFFAPLMLLAFESFDFSKYDLVISVTSEAAKGIVTKPPTKHVCICLTPTRYLWSHYTTYFKDTVFKGMAKPFVNYLRKWDKIAAERPDVMIAISTEVHRRIKKYYNRDSEIIYPPVETNKFHISNNQDNYFLSGGRLVGYKRYDLVINAFNRLNMPLVIFGTGPLEKKLREMAKNNIKFVGRVDEKEKANLYSHCQAFINPQLEDFGITAVESMAAGRPVIAFAAGGARETVVENKTGAFFDEQSWEALADTVVRFKPETFNPQLIKQYAEQFSVGRFKNEITSLVDREWQRLKNGQIRCGPW